MVEEWKDIKGHDGYQISNLGNVRSNINNRYGPGNEWHNISKYTNKLGYQSVHLGRGKPYTIHRLVANAFIPNPNNLPLVRHMDDNPSNNKVDNLAWGTQTDNMQDCVKHGRLVGDTSAAIESTKRPIEVSGYNTDFKKSYLSISDASRELGFHNAHVSKQIRGEIKQNGGYTFRYITKEEYYMQNPINSFPGYEFREYSTEENERFGIKNPDHKKHNMFRGEDVGFGGYVYSEPGMYGPTIALDVSGMHPSSIIAMNYFGEYTEKYKNMVEARAAIKHKDFDRAKELLGPECEPYLNDPSTAKALSQALKIAQNSCYGLSSASFNNPMKHPDNANNIVALRGALFMVTLRDEVQSRGYTVSHIKTDCMKVHNWDNDIKNFIIEFGKKYGYNFEVEHSFERFCLIDKANYVGKCAEDDPEHPGEWISVGKTFSIPYTFKTLFSGEEITFDDMTIVNESKKGALYLDFNEGLPEGEHNYRFIGRIGKFVPVKDGCGGAELLACINGKYSYAQGAKGWRFKEAEIVDTLKNYDQVNHDYWIKQVNDTIDIMSQFGDVEKFRSDEPYTIEYKETEELPWDTTGEGINPLTGKMNPPVEN